MFTDKPLPVPLKKPTLTPKALIHQKFGSNAIYKLEEVEERSEYGCPGLAVPQKGPCLFRCRLELPDFFVVSEACKRKKEAEQSAADMALKKLGVGINASSVPALDAKDELVARLSYLFSSEFLSKVHPLSSHIKASLQREGELSGLVPVSILIALDTKLSSLCKSLNPMVESYPVLALPLIRRAALCLSDLIVVSDDQLWIRRKKPYPSELVASLFSDNVTENQWVEAVFVPSSLDDPVRQIRLDVFSRAYYLDSIAQESGVSDASKVFISRRIGKASSEVRLYFSAPKICDSDSVLDSQSLKDPVHDEHFNARASFLSGQEIFGSSILASIAYTWKSADLFYEDVSLGAYFRMLIGRTPGGLCKLSRESLLAAELPVVFTTRAHWRGTLPRELLCTMCRQYRLSEPTFSLVFDPLEPLNRSNEDSSALADEKDNHAVANGEDAAVSEGNFRCEVNLFSKFQHLLLQCIPKESYKKQSDAVQNASLRVLLWLNMYLTQMDIHSEQLYSFGVASGIHCNSSRFSREFYLYQVIHDFCRKVDSQSLKFLCGSYVNLLTNMHGHHYEHITIGGPESGPAPSHGSLVCITYNVTLVSEDEKQNLENIDEFEFEMGTGSVIPAIEAALLQMAVGQSVRFKTEVPPHEYILAAGTDPSNALSTLSAEACFLEYSITLLRTTDPMEERMEQALFSPPLSKQRVGFALHHIRESSAKTLVDFGCGSGSLLDSLMDYTNTLESVVGVDISQKGLIRAAKVLNSKLLRSDGTTPLPNLKSLVLYEGSITDFDSRVYEFDIGTCLEVIEHMEEEQALEFGNVVLSSFRPRILIVSTPNYEYNVILQRHDISKQEDDGDDSSRSHLCKFRNHDHKFEWTRKQFRRWATDLASSYSYSVEFDGVGGVPGEEPGFASQIAVFKRGTEDCINTTVDSQHKYEVMWEWHSPLAR